MYKDYKKYEVFDYGRIWSYSRNRFLKPAKNKRGGYYYIKLYDNNGKKKDYRLHRLIYESVYGNIPEGMEVNHIDEDKSNNSITNLNLMSRKENINYGTRTARATASRDYEEIGRKLTNGVTSKQVAAYKDGVLVMTFPSTAEAQRAGFSSGHISKCCNGKLKSYKGYQWLYFDESPPLFYIAA